MKILFGIDFDTNDGIVLTEEQILMLQKHLATRIQGLGEGPPEFLNKDAKVILRIWDVVPT